MSFDYANDWQDAMRAAFDASSGYASANDLRPGVPTSYEPKPDFEAEKKPEAAPTGFVAKILDGAEAVSFEICEGAMMHSSNARNLRHCLAYGSQVYRSHHDYTIRGTISPRGFRELFSFRLGDVYVPRRRLILNCTCKINGVNETAALRPGE